MARRKIKSATDQRKFTIVYNDFLESDLLDKHEKLIYIAIKRFADNDTLKAFPSLKTLHKITGISIRWIKKSIEHMEQLGVISVEHREDDEKGHQSNIYTLYDYAEIWNVGSSEDDVAAVADEISEAKLVAELRARGYTVIKEKEPDKTEPTKVTVEPSTKLNQFDIVNTTINSEKSQELERYTIDQIRQIFDYDILVNDKPLWQRDIDSVFSILHTALNTTKETIRVGGEDKPTMIVIGKLMKLDYSEIMYCIEKYSEQTERIKNPTAYMLTLLYNAKEQMNLDISNQVQHDMYNWEPPTE